MKNKMTGIYNTPTECNGPSMEILKKQLASQKEAKEMIWDLAKNDHLPYSSIDVIKGLALVRIEETEKAIKKRKKEDVKARKALKVKSVTKSKKK